MHISGSSQASENVNDGVMKMVGSSNEQSRNTPRHEDDRNLWTSAPQQQQKHQDGEANADEPRVDRKDARASSGDVNSNAEKTKAFFLNT